MPKRTSVAFDTVRRLALAFPGVDQGTCYGTAAFRVRGKFLARLKEDGEVPAARQNAQFLLNVIHWLVGLR